MFMASLHYYKYSGFTYKLHILILSDVHILIQYQSHNYAYCSTIISEMVLIFYQNCVY